MILSTTYSITQPASFSHHALHVVINRIPLMFADQPRIHYKRLRAREIVNFWTGVQVGGVIQFDSVYDRVRKDRTPLTLVYVHTAVLVVACRKRLTVTTCNRRADQCWLVE